jgi:O-acetyl-ADP-ribose deacetylase
METTQATSSGIRFGRTLVEVVCGDILKVRAEAVVNPSNTALDVTGDPARQVSAALDHATGGALGRALPCAAPLPVPLGSVVATDGFGLPFRRVFHVAGHDVLRKGPFLATGDSEKDAALIAAITRGLQEVLRLAGAEHLESLAVPLVGAGTIGLATRHVAQLMARVLRTALEPGHQLRRVTIVARLADDARIVADALAGEGEGAATERSFGALQQPPRPDGAGVALDRVAVLEAEVARLVGENAALREAMKKGMSPRAGWPMPVAFASAMVDAETEPLPKAMTLAKAVAVTVKYLAALALADYQLLGAPDPGVHARLRECVGRATGDGRWVQAIRWAASAIPVNGGAFIREAPAIWIAKGGEFSPLLGRLQRCIQLRNELVHEGLVTSARAGVYLREALPRWEAFLDLAAPLLAYRLVWTEGVLDLPRTGGYLYLVRWLVGDQLLAPAERVAWDVRLERGKLYLAGPDQRFLPLHGFMEYAYCDVTSANEPWMIEELADQVTFTTFRFAQRLVMEVDLPEWLTT